jgi:hypothetical protein
VFGEFPPPYRFERDDLSLSLEMREGHYQYRRDLAGSRVGKDISAGLSRLLVHPVEPFYSGPETAGHLEIEFPALIIEPEATETIFLTFPVEIGVFVEGIRTTEILDAFSWDPPKYSLYGSPHRGFVTRFAWSDRYREPPTVDGARKGVLKLTIRNMVPDWAKVSRVVMDSPEMHLYSSDFAGLVAVMRIVGREAAEITGIDRPLKGGMNRARDFFTERRILRLHAAPRLPGMERKGFLMEAGLS